MSSTEQLKSVLQRIKVSNKIEADLLKDLSNQEKELLTYLHGEGLVDEALQFLKDLNEDQEWHLLKERMIASKTKVIPIWKSILRYAAIFIGLFGAIYLFRIGMGQDPDTPATDKSITLKIGEDAVRFIREGESQQIVSASGEVVGEQKGNSIRYDTDTQIDELIFNELEIPYGKIFEVVLSDGTLVHLNSGTKMRYPVKFLEGQKREVFIHGEAYFDVAKDKNRPFIVNADDLAVEVLGTEFNITSYQEDREIRTVLVEGSVSL
ncbi:MAG: FecR domain-containing protein, partial [Bacteroidota bacterium]